MHHPMNVDEFRVFGGDEEKYRLYQQAAGVLFLRFWLFFFSWEKEPMELKTWSQVLRHSCWLFFVFFQKNDRNQFFCLNFLGVLKHKVLFNVPEISDL